MSLNKANSAYRPFRHPIIMSCKYAGKRKEPHNSESECAIVNTVVLLADNNEGLELGRK